jgi:CRP/FNR family transcriptional regulator, nitrogen oxide reductase regulator
MSHGSAYRSGSPCSIEPVLVANEDEEEGVLRRFSVTDSAGELAGTASARCSRGALCQLVAIAEPESEALACVRGAPLFEGIGTVEAAQLASAASSHNYRRQEVLFREDDPLDSLFLLASGRVKITQLTRSGKEVILRVDGSGEVLEFGGGGTLHGVSAQALDPCRVFRWEVRTFAAITQRSPVIYRNITSVLAARLNALEDRFRDMATERVPQRLARILIRFFEQHTPALQAVTIGLSCEELAQMVGTTQFTVSRLLCQWAAQGIIEPERKAILIENLRALMDLAAG